jgi:hypothetical protein
MKYKILTGKIIEVGGRAEPCTQISTSLPATAAEASAALMPADMGAGLSPARELAEALWREMLVPEPTLEAWMENSARRAKEWNGAAIRTSSPEDHVADLIAAGLVVPVE